MKIIISGVPCCGKTYFGDWLRDNHGYLHLNLESRDAFNENVIARNIGAGLPSWLSGLSTNVVVTWGYPPNQQCYGIIKFFESAGFAPWWFDADHAIARGRYIQRDGEQATRQFYDAQINRLRLEEANIARLYEGRTIRTLSASGYIPSSQILLEMEKGAAHQQARA